MLTISLPTKFDFVNRESRIKAFDALGSELERYLDDADSAFRSKLDDAILKARQKNHWFEERFVLKMIREIRAWLNTEVLRAWVDEYECQGDYSKTVAIIAAGNIPMVAFHDYLSVLISGHKALVKLSSDDEELLPAMHELLSDIEPFFSDKAHFEDNLRGAGFDAIIATGSNNSSRYFEYYFSKYPNIIRKNRNGVAVLTGKESDAELKMLGHDIFDYFGLGCRNVSKLYVPNGYDFDQFYKAIYDFSEVLNNKSYTDNYEYNRTVYLMNSEKLLDNGFLLLKEDENISSPVGVLFWESYDEKDKLDKQLEQQNQEVQCILSRDNLKFGNGQNPSLSDYADGVDTMRFLDNLLTVEGL